MSVRSDNIFFCKQFFFFCIVCFADVCFADLSMFAFVEDLVIIVLISVFTAAVWCDHLSSVVQWRHSSHVERPRSLHTTHNSAILFHMHIAYV